MVSSGTREDVMVVTNKDGLPVLNPKEPSWFGDEVRFSNASWGLGFRVLRITVWSILVLVASPRRKDKP